MNVILIGAGGMAFSHAKVYPFIDDVRVSAVVDPNIKAAENIASLLSAKAYASIEEIEDKEVSNTVDLCIPSFLHYEYAMKFLNKGWNVFCEKPMAHTTRQADEMWRTASEKGIVLMVGQIVRFWPEYQYLKDMIEAAPYGPLKHMEMIRRFGCHEADSWYMDPERCKMSCFEMHIHDADFVNYLFGLPKAVSSIGIEEPGIHLSYIKTQYCYDLQMVIQAEGGWSRSSLPFSVEYLATFENAVLKYQDGEVTLYPFNGQPQKITFLRNHNLSSDLLGLLGEFQEFYHCIKTGTLPTTASLQSTRNTIYLLEKECESLRNHGLVIKL
jgi:predicted dehydrogenase